MFNRELSQRQLEAAQAVREAAREHIAYRAPSKKDQSAGRRVDTRPGPVISIPVEEYQQ